MFSSPQASVQNTLLEVIVSRASMRRLLPTELLLFFGTVACGAGASALRSHIHGNCRQCAAFAHPRHTWPRQELRLRGGRGPSVAQSSTSASDDDEESSVVEGMQQCDVINEA